MVKSDVRGVGGAAMQNSVYNILGGEYFKFCCGEES